MNEIQVKSIEKSHPGCLGRMVNMFDISNGLARNRLLTNKPHPDGSLPSKSPSDVASTLTAPLGVELEDKMIVAEFRRSLSNSKAEGTTMKTLIAKEMSKEVQLKNNSRNVVAKLMGLDNIPQQQPNSAAQTSHSKCSSKHSFMECWEQEHSFVDKKMQCEVHPSQKQDEYRDIYETWHQAQKTTAGDLRTQKGRYNEHINEKKMALICQKFAEAKCLSTFERGSQSKESQDALEVLSSNEDILQKFLQESNSMFPQHLYETKSTPPPSETNRITILRPSKAISDEKFGPERKTDKRTRKPGQKFQAIGWEKSKPEFSTTLCNWKVDEYPASSTRIVVLKPSRGKTHDVKADILPPSSQLKMYSDRHFSEESKDERAQESKEMEKEITCRLSESLVGDQSDETLPVSVLSNGYICDDSSVNKSENEDVENLSDLEILSPTSRHSWDYINRFGTPFSSSSFSRRSCSSASSVCKEAKKRLSERFALMTANESSLEKARRSSSTLGEMLALSDTKKSGRSEEKAAENEYDTRGSTSCSNGILSCDGVADSPKSLLRSRSLPVSPAGYDSRLSIQAPDLEADRMEVARELTMTKSSKSSLREKVSNLFFSRNKKISGEKYGGSASKFESHTATSEAPGSPVPFPQITFAGATPCHANSGIEECLSRNSPNRAANQSLGDRRTELGIVFQEEGSSMAKHLMTGNNIGNQDQPSPISVLEPPFEDDNNTISEISLNSRDASLKSNLIDKSPPIGSIARTLSWDDSCVDIATACSFKHTSVSSAEEEEEDDDYDWHLFIQTLLSEAGFIGNIPSDSSYARWHSPESPLDPMLCEKYVSQNDKDLHEARRRQRRSYRKLAFDCVNAAIMEITGFGTNSNMRPISSAIKISECSTTIMLDHLWDEMRDWFCTEVKCTYEGGDDTSLVVEGMVRKEMKGRWWIDHARFEADNLGQEIEGKLLEELLEDAVAVFTGRA